MNKFKHGKNLKIIDKRTTYIDKSVIIGDNVTIYPNNTITNGTIIESNVILLSGNIISNSKLHPNTIIESSNIKDSEISEYACVGPFARLRPNSFIGKNCKIGNFVEIKNSTIGDCTKVSHLTYVGDSILGKNCNIGCGVIFINYNGVLKHRSIVGDNCFIGSNVNIIAPVKIESNSYICAGTTITKNVKNDDFVIGRPNEIVKENYASKYLERQRKIKAECNKEKI